MLEVPLTVADGDTDSALYDVREVLGTLVELEDYAICGLRLPTGLEATAANLLMGWDDETALPYYDDAGVEVPIVVGASRVVRLKASDFPILPPFLGISLGTAASGADREIAILLRKV